MMGGEISITATGDYWVTTDITRSVRCKVVGRPPRERPGATGYLPLTAFFASARSRSVIRPASVSHMSMVVEVGILRPVS